MKDVILVLTNSQDGEHSDVVIRKLQQRGEHVIRLDVDRIERGGVDLTFQINAKLDRALIISTSDGVCSPEQIKSVWYRRPNRFSLTIQDEVQRRFAEGELGNFLEGLLCGIPDSGI